MSARPSSRQKEPTEGHLIIVEEKISKNNGDIMIKKHLRGKFLGKGGFAECYELTNLESKQLSAAKIVKKASLTKNRAKQKLMSEIRIHRSLHHQNVVGFENFFEDPENVYIILELCANQTLNDLLKRRKRLTELELQCYMVQLISGLKYLHSHRVIHRDLKLGNLFLSDKMELKIADFGLATKLDFEGDRKRTICGTPNYIAPEILEGKQGHSYEVDIWSVGVILYTLLIGKPPFETKDVKHTYQRIRMGNYNFPEQVVISDAAKDLIQKMLQLDPTKRLTLDQVLEHDFFHTGYPIPKLMPASTLACPPSATYTKQFKPDNTSLNEMSAQKQFGSTMPTPGLQESIKPNKERINMMNTEKVQGKLGAMASSTKSDLAGKMVSPRTSGLKEVDKNAKTLEGPEIWIKKWVDYSSKYGLGYLLSNSAMGVFFNDSSKIILDVKGYHFEYLERRGVDRQDVSSTYNLMEYPKELQKKVTLLQHFRSYLEDGAKSKEELKTEELPKKESSTIYVKKWMRTKHAILFRLSNKLVQVIFQDHTEIILSSESRVVTFVNKKAERMSYPLTSALESSNMEMVKRLRYTKDLLTHMLNNNQTGPSKQANTGESGGTSGGPTFNSTGSSRQIAPFQK